MSTEVQTKILNWLASAGTYIWENFQWAIYLIVFVIVIKFVVAVLCDL